MSADNTILILKNRCPDGGFQYRVRLVVAAENLQPCEDERVEQLKARQWFILTWFGNARVYRSSAKARSAARQCLYRMTKRGRLVEYGIGKLDLASELFPVDSLSSIEAWLKERRVFPFQKTTSR